MCLVCLCYKSQRKQLQGHLSHWAASGEATTQHRNSIKSSNMLPLLVASYLNATSTAFAARTALLSQTTDPSLANSWASAKPGDCSLTAETGDAPAAGDTGCTATHGEGGVAWSIYRYCQDSSDWALYCIGDTWTAVSGNTMSQFVAGGQPWALIQPDTDNSRPDAPESWQRGTMTGSASLNAKCDDPAPSGWRNGGGLVICVDALANGELVAAICNLGKADDTPGCATSFNQLGAGSFGTSFCPTS